MYGEMSPKELGKRLWGDAWVDPNTRAFRKGYPPPDCQRTFVQFILEPMYKIYSQVRCPFLECAHVHPFCMCLEAGWNPAP